MQKKWNSVEELKFSNRAFSIFEKYRIDQSLFPEIQDGEYYIIQRESVYNLINEVVLLCAKEHPLWNFGKFPYED